MKIVHIVPSIDREAAGPSYTVPALIRALAKLKLKVTLGTLASNENAHEYEVVSFDMLHVYSRLGISHSMRLWLNNLVKQRQVDIFHVHSLWMMPNVYPGWAARGTSVKLIVSPRGTLSSYALNINKWVKKLFWIFLQGPVVQKASCLHATADSEYKDMRALGLTQPICIIPNGINVPVLQLKRSTSNKRTLLYLGRIHPKKGLLNLLNAWAQVETLFPNWNLKIVGPDEGNHLEELLNLRNKLSLKNVEFSGPVYGEEKLTAYRDADLFVLPTYSENFGMTVAESLSVGTPVIVSKGAPWSELSKMNAGWWIDIGVHPLVSCLQQAFSMSREDLITMGIAGRSWMLDSYSWDAIASEMAMVYRWMLEGGVPPKSVVLT